ncbi:MAG: peptidase [Hyphomicrobium sp.]|uniref:imelysin family protein n=1 Tax=Hyphomicrobium sp. TaxID=82 RepID=UPI0025C49556|nr:imelysin family protein [Hyphomicrobium sp.]MBZ0210711.1 peptidase [Hyphomicrobium sp.]
MLRALAAPTVCLLCAAALPPVAAADAPDVAAVAKTSADIAEAGYTDSLIEARKLEAAIDTLIKTPTEDNLATARKAWIAARVPYMQTEAFRFGNKIVDDWEGRVNAWPLDEGLIDYVSQDYVDQAPANDLYVANIIANTSIKIAGEPVDTSNITKELLSGKLQEAGGVESNVATGYHAIEFLLWGQDLNGTGPGAGNRPATDYDTKSCTGGHCDRRAQYLEVVTDLLLDDLAFMAAQWGPDGAARQAVMADGGRAALIAIFKGLGSLSYGEMAGERMKLALLIHDPEEEHDCFSDNTHDAHYYDALGIRNVYLGSYKRLDGSVVAGPSPSDIVRAKSAEADARTQSALDETMKLMDAIGQRAKGGEAYDQMIGEGNEAGNALVDEAIQALIAQAKEFERDITALDLKAIEFEGSDSLDSPGNVR